MSQAEGFSYNRMLLETVPRSVSLEGEIQMPADFIIRYSDPKDEDNGKESVYSTPIRIVRNESEGSTSTVVSYIDRGGKIVEIDMTLDPDRRVSHFLVYDRLAQIGYGTGRPDWRMCPDLEAVDYALKAGQLLRNWNMGDISFDSPWMSVLRDVEADLNVVAGRAFSQ